MAKKNFLKKTLAIALAATFVLSAAPLAGLCGIALPSLGSVTANAAEEEPVWTVATDDMLRIEGNTIVGYTDKLAGNIEIPTHINGTAITSIKSDAFNGCLLITAVKIPDSIESIGIEAFQNCSVLETIYFNATNCTVGGNTNNYNGCNAFKKIVFGKDVTAIPANACLYASSLQDVIFKGTVTKIGASAFEGCPSLNEIYLDAYSEETFNFYALEIGSGNDIVTKDIFTFGLKTVDKTNDEFGVTVSYPSNAFDEEVELSVTKVEGGRDDSAVYISDGELFKQTGCFDIKMVLANGSSTNAVQPDGKVTVKMEIPSDYIGKTNIKIVHRLSNGSRENFSFSPRSGEKKLKVSEDKKYWVFEVESFSEFEICEVNPVPSVLIRNNTGSKSIGYGETLRLTANAKNMPADAKIVWYVNDKLEGEGTTFEVSPESGSVKVTVKIVDADGETYAGAEITDSQNVSVKSGFFQKLISFFKNLFGINRIITQMLDVK